jgi:hypothetical protein
MLRRSLETHILRAFQEILLLIWNQKIRCCVYKELDESNPYSFLYSNIRFNIILI